MARVSFAPSGRGWRTPRGSTEFSPCRGGNTAAREQLLQREWTSLCAHPRIHVAFDHDVREHPGPRSDSGHPSLHALGGARVTAYSDAAGLSRVWPARWARMSPRGGKTAAEHWFDLFGRTLTRRDLVRIGCGAAGVVALGGLPGCIGRPIRFSSDPFTLGVASGDPMPDSIVLWARLDAGAVGDAGAIRDPIEVRWELAADDSFHRIVRSGRSDALPELGHSVHVEAGGLGAGTEYFYRFHCGGATSPVGRAKTLPELGAHVSRFDFAFASCQHYEQGYFTALRHLSEEDVDLIVHLGDYIYEGARAEGGVRTHEGPEVLTLEQYRARYSTYRRDLDLQAAHHAAPWVASTDDHEVDNNYAGATSDDDMSPENFLLRRAAAYQAFYEFMPLRRSTMPVGPNALMYRRLTLGSLMEMSVLDTRQYRDDQACGDRFKPSCDAHRNPDRSILGSAQRDWLFDALAESGARWNVLAQQVLMARFRGYDEQGRETWTMDKWDGYPADRSALLDTLATESVSNPIVLTGDIHSTWVGRLLRDFDDVDSEIVGTEFTCTSLTSGGNGEPEAAIGARALPFNPHFDFYNSQRGYALCSVTPDLWSTTYRRVPEVDTPGGLVETLATFAVENGRPGAHPA